MTTDETGIAPFLMGEFKGTLKDNKELNFKRMLVLELKYTSYVGLKGIQVYYTL